METSKWREPPTSFAPGIEAVIVTKVVFFFVHICFIFTPKLGEDEPILTVAYFFRWVEKTTNQFVQHLKATQKDGRL